MPHGDFTGNQKQKLAQQYAREQQLRANSLSMVSSIVDDESKQEIILFPDKLNDLASYVEETDPETGEVKNPLDPAWDPMRFRSSDTVEDVTYGNDGIIFQLDAGREYIAPRCVVEHLDSQDLVWH